MPIESESTHTRTQAADQPEARPSARRRRAQPAEPDSALDLRRDQSRRLAETLVARAAFLDSDERTLVLAVYAKGQCATDLARIASVPPRRIRRRLHAIVRRMLTPEFAFVAARKDQWSPALRRIGTACFLRGLALQPAARELGMSYHTVRRHRDGIAAMCTLTPTPRAHQARTGAAA